MKSIYWVVILLGTLAAITSGIAIYSLAQSQDLVNNGIATKGTVIGLGYAGKGAYFPVVKFQTTSGDTMKEKSSFGSSPPAYKVGDQVEVFYDKRDPKRWTINNPFQLYFLAAIFGLFGTLLMTATTIVLVAAIRGRPVPGTSASMRR